MDSLRSTHARVAALARRRAPDDPELVAAREELARCLEQTNVLRTRLGSLSPTVCAQILPLKDAAGA